MLHAIYHAIAWLWGGDGQGGPEGDGYLITSGPLPASAVIAGVIVWLLGLRCEEQRCWRRARRTDAEGQRLCIKHHELGLPANAWDAVGEIRQLNEPDP